jgi:predicted nucleic acid-binding protein
MKNIFIDTNIIIDLLADRKPYSKHAIELFSKAEKQELKLFASSHSIVTTHYLMKKYLNEEDLRILIENLLEYLNIVTVDINIIKKSLRSAHRDFEDAVQIFCANTIENIYCIVTRNLKDFQKCELLVLSPDQVI